jgi:hypothetical protein
MHHVQRAVKRRVDGVVSGASAVHDTTQSALEALSKVPCLTSACSVAVHVGLTLAWYSNNVVAVPRLTSTAG